MTARTACTTGTVLRTTKVEQRSSIASLWSKAVLIREHDRLLFSIGLWWTEYVPLWKLEQNVVLLGSRLFSRIPFSCVSKFMFLLTFDLRWWCTYGDTEQAQMIQLECNNSQCIDVYTNVKKPIYWFSFALSFLLCTHDNTTKSVLFLISYLDDLPRKQNQMSWFVLKDGT